MRVLLLSAYDAGSHRYWYRQLQRLFGDWHWQVLALPPRHFSWRVRGSPLHWALSERNTLEAGYDLLIATSMVDLATLRGLVPSLSSLPTLLYFHENQFDYPPGQHRHGMLEAQMVSLYSALSADAVLFNSAYNRDTFLAGVDDLLRRLPDFAPREAVRSIAARTRVIAVPVSPPEPPTVPELSLWGEDEALTGRPLRLLWSGRFEHDKGGEGLERVLKQLEVRAVDYKLALCGQTFRQRPAVFERIAGRYAGRLVHMGWLEHLADYHRLLSGADIVLSTALHEFQGVAVMEAVQGGCIPVVPDRLAYRELYPPSCRYLSAPEDPDAEAAAAAALIAAVAADPDTAVRRRPDFQVFTPAALAPSYGEIFADLLRRPRDGLAD